MSRLFSQLLPLSLFWTHTLGGRDVSQDISGRELHTDPSNRVVKDRAICQSLHNKVLRFSHINILP